MTTATKPTRQEYESITFRTTPQRPSRQEYETTLAPPIQRPPIQRPQAKSRIYGPEISGPFDVWAAPADSEIWKSPGADFVKGFGQGWMRQTQVPALMGKKLPPPITRAEKIGEGAGRMMEAVTELIAVGAILRGIGMLSGTIPKGAWLGRALQTGFLFSTQQVTEEARKAVAEAIYDEDFGSRGGMAVMESFALGAVLSLAGSGIGKVWNRLKPTEQAKALKTLGLKKGASLYEINKAARREAIKFHPDKVKGMREQFERVINARNALRKTNAGDVIIANAKQNFKKQLMGKTGVSSEVADVAIKRLDAGESITKVDQMISQAKMGVKPLITAPPKDVVVPPTVPIVAPEPTPKPITPEKAVEVPLTFEEHLEQGAIATTELQISERTEGIFLTRGIQTKEGARFHPEVMKLNTEETKLYDKGSKLREEGNNKEGYKLQQQAKAMTMARYKASIGVPAKPVAGREAEIAPAAKPEAKQPWEMTREEYGKQPEIKKLTSQVGVAPTKAANRYLQDKQIDSLHKIEVQKALSEGKPVPAEVLAEYPDLAPVTPPEAVEVVAEGKVYHGTSTQIEELKTDTYSTTNIYGQGFYTTSEKIVATGYMKKGKGITPTVYDIILNKGAEAKLYDMEQSIPDDVKNALKEAFEDYGYVLDESSNLREAYDNLRYEATSDELSADSVQEYFEEAQKVLEKKGYIGLKHKGGLQVKGKPHIVRIFWNPKRDLALAQPPTVAKPKAVEVEKAVKPVRKSVKAISKDFWLDKVSYKDTLAALEQKRAQIEADPKYKNPKGDFNIFTPLGRKKLDEVGWAITRVLARKGKPGFIDVTPLLKVHKTFMGIVEPSKIVEMKLGKEPYATVIKGVHEVDVGRIEFNEAQIEGQDKSLGQLSQWFSRFSDKDLKNFMISRGTPRSEVAKRIQYEARGKLPKELKRGDLFNTAQRIADSNYKYLQSVVGDDIHRVEDYFYGIWKNPKKVDKLLDYWHTTKRFTKEKKLPTVADAMDYDSTMELRNWNPIENLKAEYIAISHLEGMNWMKDELLRTGKGKYIDSIEDAPLEWEKVQDPVFRELRLQPDLAKLINNLIATNKITQIPFLNTLREINNVARTIKFVGSAFHLLSVAKQSVADSGYLGFLYKPTALRGFTRGFRANDPIFKTTAYKDYIRHGGGHRYSVESEARRTFNRVVNELNKNMGIAVKVGALPLKIPTGFVNWMFQSYIPKVKYSKFLDVVAEKEKKFNRKLTSPEKIDIIKEQQNFYGMMNERLFGRSGTVTSAMRFYFMSPGYAEGNYRTMLKAATQWGGKSGVSANRSRSNILNAFIISGITATVGTLAFTGRLPQKPKTLQDLRDFWKIDTGKVDEKGRRIMIDMMTFERDYWNVIFNTLRLRPDIALEESWKRIGGMKAPTAEMIVDLALMSMGKAIYDWKGDRVVEITDPFLLKAMKLTVFEIKKLSPISVSVFQQSKKRDIDTTVAAIETLLGFRPTKTEKDLREQKIISKMYSLAGQREEMSYYIGQSTDPKKTVDRYNKTVNDILNSPYVPKSMKDEWGKRLLVDYDKVVTWKRFPAGKMTNAELNRAYDAHTLSVPYKRRGEPFRMIGEPKKGSERRVKELQAEAGKRGITLKRGPRRPPRR